MQLQKRLSLIVAAVSAVIVILLIFAGINMKTDARNQSVGYVLKSWRNTVVLYGGDEIVKTYSDIVLDTLPEADRRRLSSGVSFATLGEADAAAEDYDG